MEEFYKNLKVEDKLNKAFKSILFMLVAVILTGIGVIVFMSLN